MSYESCKPRLTDGRRGLQCTTAKGRVEIAESEWSDGNDAEAQAKLINERMDALGVPVDIYAVVLDGALVIKTGAESRRK